MCTGTIAFVRSLSASATSAGAIVQLVGSMSISTGVAPVARIAPTVAKKVCETVITSSPGPTPSAFKASSSAVVPFETATQSEASHASANSASKAAVSGPLMNTWRSSTRSSASAISPSIARYCALRSTSGRLVGLDSGQLPELDPRTVVRLRGRGRLEDLNHSGRVFEVRQRLVTGEDALEKVSALRLQRLDVRQPRHVHVAGALDQPELAEALELTEGATEMLTVDPGIVDRQLAGDVVVDNHLAAAGDGHPPHLVRAEPGELDVRHREVVLEHDEREVGNARLQVVVGVAVHGNRAGVEPMLDDRDVVRAEIPDRIDVAAHSPEIEPLRVDVVHLPQLAVVEQLAHVLDGGAEAEGVPNHQRQAGFSRLLA